MKSNRSDKPPFYIVGLPAEPLEAAEAELKFQRLSTDLVKAFPYVEEVRAVVKSRQQDKPEEQVGPNARYEVSVEVYTPKQVHSFSASGHNLAAVFDAMGPKMKRLLGSKQSRVTRTGGISVRKRAPPEKE